MWWLFRSVRSLPVVNSTFDGVDNSVALPPDHGVCVLLQCVWNIALAFPACPHAYDALIVLLGVFDFPIYPGACASSKGWRVQRGTDPPG